MIHPQFYTNEALMFTWFDASVEDRERTFNINMHTYGCFALCPITAIDKMLIARPEFQGRKITSLQREPYFLNTQYIENIQPGERQVTASSIELDSFLDRIKKGKH